MIPSALAGRLDLAALDEIRLLIAAAVDARTREIHARLQREHLHGASLFSDTWLLEWYPEAFAERAKGVGA